MGVGGLTAVKAFWAFAVALAITVPIGLWILWRALRISTEINTKLKTPSWDHNDNSPNLFLFSLPFLIAQILSYFVAEFDVLLAKAYTTPQDTALFGLARRLIAQMNMPMQILVVSIGSTIAELNANNRREDLQQLLRYTATLACSTIPMLLIGAIFSKTILGVLFGSFYRDGATVFSIMAIGQAINCLTGLCGTLLMLCGRAKGVLVVSSVGTVVIVLLGSYMAKWYGIQGLAWSTASVVIFQNFVMWIMARSMLGYWTHPTLDVKQAMQVLRNRRK